MSSVSGQSDSIAVDIGTTPTRPKPSSSSSSSTKPGKSSRSSISNGSSLNSPSSSNPSSALGGHVTLSWPSYLHIQWIKFATWAQKRPPRTRVIFGLLVVFLFYYFWFSSRGRVSSKQPFTSAILSSSMNGQPNALLDLNQQRAVYAMSTGSHATLPASAFSLLHQQSSASHPALGHVLPSSSPTINPGISLSALLMESVDLDAPDTPLSPHPIPGSSGSTPPGTPTSTSTSANGSGDTIYVGSLDEVKRLELLKIEQNQLALATAELVRLTSAMSQIPTRIRRLKDYVDRKMQRISVVGGVGNVGGSLGMVTNSPTMTSGGGSSITSGSSGSGSSSGSGNNVAGTVAQQIVQQQQQQQQQQLSRLQKLKELTQQQQTTQPQPQLQTQPQLQPQPQPQLTVQQQIQQIQQETQSIQQQQPPPQQQQQHAQQQQPTPQQQIVVQPLSSSSIQEQQQQQQQQQQQHQDDSDSVSLSR